MLMMTLSYFFIFIFFPPSNIVEGQKRPNRLIHTFALSRLHRSPLFFPTGDIYIYLFFVSVHFNKPLENKTGGGGGNFYLKFKTGIKRNRLFSSYFYFYIHFLKLEFRVQFFFIFQMRKGENHVWCQRSNDNGTIVAASSRNCHSQKRTFLTGTTVTTTGQGGGTVVGNDHIIIQLLISR